MERMTFNADRTTLTEGEIIEINWSCPNADRTELCIDNGYKASTIALEKQGSKRFRLNRSKGRTRLTLTAWVMNKSFSKTLRVKVKELPVTKAETVDSKGRTLGALGQWWQQRVLPRWRTWSSNYRTALQALPPGKRLARRILLLLGVLLLLSLVAPWMFSIGLLALMGYLVWFILKK